MFQFYRFILVAFLTTTSAQTLCAQSSLVPTSKPLALADDLKSGPASELAAKQIEFYRSDLDGDLLLNAAEQQNREAGKEPPSDSPYMRFARFDQDGNQQLNLAEYIALREKAPDEIIQKELATFDLDGNGEFSYSEFLESPPGANAADVRFRRWDKDQNQQLTAAEYLARFHSSLKSKERPGFFYRDNDGSLTLSFKEYSAPPESWKPHLRSRYAILDIDGNGEMSAKEYVAPHVGHASEPAAANEAKQFDINSDGILQVREFALSPQSGLSESERFDHLDTNNNFVLELDEYLWRFTKKRHSTERPGFFYQDRDGDLKLSLSEFLSEAKTWQPHLNSRYAILDANDDAIVSREEYVAPHRNHPTEQAATNEAQQFDLDGNGHLEIREYALTPQANLSPTEILTRFDVDGDNQIHRNEYLDEFPEQMRFERAIWYLNRDHDLNHQLSLPELQSQPSLPVNAFSETIQEKIKQAATVWQTHDRDRDNSLSRSELIQFCHSQAWPSLVPHLEEQVHIQQKFSWIETQKRLQTAFGLQITDGLPLRFDDGTIIDWAFITKLDENGDLRVSNAEFTRNYFEGRNTLSQFRQFDSNRDGFLGEFELVDQKLFSINYVHDFCRYDHDFDGELTQHEIDNDVNDSQRPLCRFLVAVYDRNSNGKLDLAEYSHSVLANPLLDWYAPQVDDSGDGQLSRSEFFSEGANQFPLLVDVQFEYFDRDNDHRLAHDEFPFKVDFSRLDADAAYAILDQNRDQLFNSDDFNLLHLAGISEFAATDFRLMQVEDAIQFADSNADSSLSLDEAKANWQQVKSAFRGQFTPEQKVTSAPEGVTASNRETGMTLKRTLLILFNLMFIVTLAIFVFHRLKDSNL